MSALVIDHVHYSMPVLPYVTQVLGSPAEVSLSESLLPAGPAVDLGLACLILAGSVPRGTHAAPASHMCHS